MWGNPPLHTGDTKEDQHQIKSLVTRNLQLNFMPFDQEPIPVTYMAGEADLMQRHEHFAAHPIAALQEQTPEH
jgi:hypothetical protein